MDKISIITVCYNAEKTIEQTILSVLNQSYGMDNIEYIIIDGKSTDATVDIINKYRDKIAYFVSEPDKGLYDAMNKGIAVATGEVIGILNADDWYVFDALEKVMECFKDETADIVYGEINRVEKDGSISKVKKVDALSQIWYYLPIWHPSTFVKREVYSKLGDFSLEYEIASDYDFIMRCYINNANFIYLDKVLTNFRCDGISNTKHLKCAKEAGKIALQYIEKAPNRQNVIDENEYKIKCAIFKDKCDNAPHEILDVIPQMRANKVVVWGAGIWGRNIVDVLRNAGIEIDYLVDTNRDKEGHRLLGKEIRYFDALKGSDAFVIVAMRRINSDVVEQLEELGIKREQYLFLEEWMSIVSERQKEL